MRAHLSDRQGLKQSRKTIIGEGQGRQDSAIEALCQPPENNIPDALFNLNASLNLEKCILHKPTLSK